MLSISVVMAVYNAEEYLEDAIRSVINQKFKDWELICVNDGSTDSSLQILQKYAEKYNQINIITQTNQGPAAARGKAYAISKGKYIINLDADDFFSPELLMNVYNKALDSDADAVCPDVKMETAPNSKSYWLWNAHHKIDTNIILSGRDAFIKTFPWTVHGWNLWRGDLIRENAVGEITTFNQYNADEYITRLLFLKSKKVAFSDGFYIYRFNTNSITRKISTKQLGKLITDTKIHSLAIENKIEKKFLIQIETQIFNNLVDCQLKLIYLKRSLSRNEISNYQNQIRILYNSLFYKNEIELNESILKKVFYTKSYYIFYIVTYFKTLINRICGK